MKRALALVVAISLATTCARGTVEKRPVSDLEPVQGLEWKTLKPTPTQRAEVTSVAIGGQIYSMGGLAPGMRTVVTGNVEIYDTQTNEYTLGPDLPLPVHHAASTSLNGTIYILGGYMGRGLSNPTDRAFALRGGQWQELPKMPWARAAAGAAEVGGKIYVAGGIGSEGLVESVLSFDPTSNTWDTLSTSLPTKREHLGVSSDGRYLYVIGGRAYDVETEHLNYFPLVEAFDPAVGKWIKMPKMSTARGSIGTVITSNGFIVVIGGHAKTVFDKAEALDVNTRRWIALPSMPTGRVGMGVAAVGAMVYAIGGETEVEFAFSTVNEAVDLAALKNSLE